MTTRVHRRGSRVEYSDHLGVLAVVHLTSPFADREAELEPVADNLLADPGEHPSGLSDLL